jgi:hypothetical protein
MELAATFFEQVASIFGPIVFPELLLLASIGLWLLHQQPPKALETERAQQAAQTGHANRALPAVQ